MSRQFSSAGKIFFVGIAVLAAVAAIPVDDAPILADAALDGMMLEWS